MQMASSAGIRIENEKNSGIGNLLSEVWEKGPKGWSAEKTSSFMESRAARMDTFSGRNSAGLSATSLTQHLDDVLPLALDTFFNPALEEKEFNHARELVLEDIKTLEDSPTRLLSKMFAETLFEGHPYGLPGVGFEKTVQSFTPADLAAHFKKCTEENRIVVSVSGKFNVEKMCARFEAVKRKPAKIQSFELPFQPPLAPRLAEVKKDREQSHIIVGFLGTRISDPRRYALKVLLNVMGGQSGRLFTEIRDKQGLCYTVAPICMEGIEPGYIGIYIGCDPGKREQSIKSIHHELKRLADKPITAAELTRAKEYILGKHHMEMQLNSSISTATCFNTLYGLSENEHENWEEKLKKVDAKSLKLLAENLFSQPSVTAVVI